MSIAAQPHRPHSDHRGHRVQRATHADQADQADRADLADHIDRARRADQADGAAQPQALRGSSTFGARIDQALEAALAGHAVSGAPPRLVAALRPVAEILPGATPLNVNTAAREVIAAVLDVDLGTAERLVQARQRSPIDSLERLKAFLPQGATPDARRIGFASNHFEVTGRLRLDERELEERALMQRRGSGSATEVVALRRERRSLPAELR